MTRARATNREPSGRSDSERSAGELVIIPPKFRCVWRACRSARAAVTMAAGRGKSIRPDAGGGSARARRSGLAAQPDGDQPVASADAELAKDIPDVAVQRRRRDADF